MSTDAIPTVEEVNLRIQEQSAEGVETLTKIGVWLRETATFSDRGIADYREWPEEYGNEDPCTAYVISELRRKGWRAKLYYGYRSRFKNPVLRIQKP